MVALGLFFVFLMLLGVIQLRRGRLWDSRWLLRAFVWATPLPIAACELGWMAAEVGRQPWIVYHVLRTSDAISRTVSAGEILLSLVAFGSVYLLLGSLYVYDAIWFALIGGLLIGYAILDGFDLGVGVLHLFTRDELHRRINVNAIGPVWDGNEVWLIAGGAALFAAFPVVYATTFSAFYLALLLLLIALMFRAVSFEFRGKVASPRWRAAWDRAFGIGSLAAALLLGVALGNILRGLPIDAEGTFTGSFLGLLNPYALLVGVLGLALFVMHGALYLTLKTDGEQRAWLAGRARAGWMVVVTLYVVATVATFFEAGFLFRGFMADPLRWLLVPVLLAWLLYVPVAVGAGRYTGAFLASTVAITALLGVVAASLFPRLVPSRIDLAYSLTAYNAASTPRTLRTMLVIALIGMPFVLGYTAFVYRVFRGKVVLGPESY